jgi:hypothetical protein
MMRFILSAFLAFSLGSMSYSVRAQVPNGGFETWTDACTLADWFNSTICGVATPVTKTTDAHGGSFAVRGEVVSLFGQTLAPILQSGSDAQGVPISERYVSVDGFYKFAPVGGDRWGVNVVFQKGDTVVAQGAALFPAASVYTPFSVTMVYQTADIPITAIIQVQLIGPVTGSDYHLGSVMYVDDITFGSGTGTTPEARLSIVLNMNLVVITWPAQVLGYKLQQTSTLSPTAWEDVPGLTATDRSYSFTPTTQKYFRLLKP